MTIDINPQFAIGPIPECQLSCQNDGYCTYVSTDKVTLLETFASGGMIEHCVCPPGFSGLACENVVEQCHDLKCHNGAPCSLKDDQYVCDCSGAEAVSRFAGSMCHDPATSYCGGGDIQNRSFCTNGGLCLGNILHQTSEYSTHDGCHCPPEFEGPHCEYLKGMAADAFEELHLKSSTNDAVQVAALSSPTKDGVEANAESTPMILLMQESENASSPSSSGIFAPVGILVGIAMSTIGLAIMLQHRKRSRRNKTRDILDRACYVDQTPIRVRIMGENESLETVLEDGHHGYVDEDDMRSISECSLEEIELEDNNKVANSYRDYLQGIRDGGYETYFDSAPDFTNIVGSPGNGSDEGQR